MAVDVHGAADLIDGEAHGDGGSSGVLHGIGETFGDEEVGGRLGVAVPTGSSQTRVPAGRETVAVAAFTTIVVLGSIAILALSPIDQFAVFVLGPFVLMRTRRSAVASAATASAGACRRLWVARAPIAVAVRWL